MCGDKGVKCVIWIGLAGTALVAMWLYHCHGEAKIGYGSEKPHQMMHNCGVESVAFLASYYGIANPGEVRRVAAQSNCVKPDGSISMADLIVLCNTVGLGEWRGLHADIEDLSSVPTPFIAHLQYNVGHIVVCNKLSEQYVQVVDMVSDHGPIANMPIEAFKSRFKGAIAVPIEPLEHRHE